jgi:voltage-gated potassium channel
LPASSPIPEPNDPLLAFEPRFTSTRQGHARRVERLWRWPMVIALLLTQPAFYLELLDTTPPLYAVLSYLAAALVMLASMLHTGWRSGHLASHLKANAFDGMLVAGLLLSAVAPPSTTSNLALLLRVTVGIFTLGRMVWAAHYVVTRGGAAYKLMVALGVLLVCGLGFRWLEPSTPTLAEGLWLAFITAATVGYGDVVPTTPASRVFAVFVVFLGVGAVTLVTAAIASAWVETDERRIEREVLHDLRRQIGSLHDELVAMRAQLQALVPLQGSPIAPPPAAARRPDPDLQPPSSPPRR